MRPLLCTHPTWLRECVSPITGSFASVYSYRAQVPAQAQPAAAPQTQGVVKATQGHLYELGPTGAFEPVASCGIAILGGPDVKHHQMLCYDAAKQTLCAVQLHPTFELTMMPNYYCSFFDNAQKQWSICFRNQEDASSIAQAVALGVSVTCGDAIKVVKQDLIVGSGHDLQLGDQAAVRYTGWLTGPTGRGSIGSVFDTNNTPEGKPYKLKLGESKVIAGWHQGLIGMKKGGKRFLVIGPGDAYGAQGMPPQIAPNAMLHFEIVVEKMRKDTSNAAASAAPSAEAAAAAPSAAPAQHWPNRRSHRRRLRSLPRSQRHRGLRRRTRKRTLRR